MHPLRLAVRDMNEAGLAEIAARLRGAVVEPAGDLVQKRPEGFDAVLILQPGPEDLPAVEALLAEGTHVLLVAEPCPSRAMIERLEAAPRRAGTQLAVLNPDRFLPSRQLIRQQLPNPIGAAGLIRLHRWEPTNFNKPIDPESMPDPLLRDIDVAIWLMGRPVDRAFAIERRSEYSGSAAGRSMFVHLGFPGGGMALLDYDGRLPPGDNYNSLSVISANGAAYADDHQNVQLAYGGGSPRAVRTEERNRQLSALAQDFIDQLREGRDLDSGVSAWRQVFAAAEAVRRSLASGPAVPVEGS